jgi:hypothetical protein
VQTLWAYPVGPETVGSSSARAEACQLDNLLRSPRSKEIS